MKSAGPAVAALLAAAAIACGGEPEASPYVDEQARAIKALSPDQVAALLAGEGMGYALAAELNGVPGPRHVLDAADELELDPDQRAQVQTIFDSMQAEAIRLGGELVAAERHLDRMFAAGHPTPDSVAVATAEIARIEGALRNVHLRAHLQTAPLLTPAQRTLYAEVRGYDRAPAAGSEGHGEHHGG